MIKEALRCVCSLCLAASLSACSSSRTPTSGEKTPFTIINPSAEVTPLPNGAEVDYVAKYYPELKDFDLKSSGQLITKKGVIIKWFNYTEYLFNQEAAASTFSYFQDIMPQEGLRTQIIYRGEKHQ